MNPPSISIVMPAWDGEEFFAAATKSLPAPTFWNVFQPKPRRPR